MSRSCTDMRIVLPMSMTVRHKILRVAVVIASVLLLVPAVVASRQRSSPPVSEESAIRTLLSHWIDAYQHLDAKQLAGLETPDVEVVEHYNMKVMV
jgi:hypothetical protein